LSWKDDWIRKAKEHKEAGEFLYKRGFYRDAISRLYYSAFSLMVAISGEAPKGRWEHKGILKPFQRWLYEKGSPLSREELGLLREFYERRREADYETDITLLKEEVEDYIKLVNRLFEVIDDSREDNT
jgi:uncharacterized protein (UPF0332 family)